MFRRQAFVKIIQYDHRTYGFTIPAGHTFASVDVARLLAHPDFKITSNPIQLHDLSICHDFNVRMPAYLDQFWRDGAHSTVIGWEGFIQLGHLSPNGRFGFDHIYFEALVS